MLKEFGSMIEETEFILSEWSVGCLDDLTSVRATVSHNEKTGSGFLFWNQYQRHAVLENHSGEKITVD